MAIRTTRSSGNVFRDLGFPPGKAERLQVRADLMIRLDRSQRDTLPMRGVQYRLAVGGIVRFATSRPDLLEVDLKRQGRLDVHIPLFPPQTSKEMHALLMAVADTPSAAAPSSRSTRGSARRSSRTAGTDTCSTWASTAS